MRALRPFDGEQASISGSVRGRKMDDSELSDLSEAPPEQHMRVESAAP